MTGAALTDVVSIGIGGSYLGPEFVAEALRTDPRASTAAAGRRLRFLATVDPVDVSRALDGLDARTTLVVIVSKTFTTAETMLNARTLRRWLTDALVQDGVSEDDVVGAHMIAVSSNVDRASQRRVCSFLFVCRNSFLNHRGVAFFSISSCCIDDIFRCA